MRHHHQLLKDMRVVELASVLAGPAVGMFFAELGARVLKIENPHTGGDVTRSWKLASEDPESPVSAYFASVNVGKEHLFMDLQSEDAKRFLHENLEQADVLIMNFKSGDAEKFGLSKEKLRAQYPSLIIGNITGFQSDPQRTAYDVVVQAECGFMGMNGTKDSGPVKMPVALMDVLAAHHLKEGVLLALLRRYQDGKGAWIESSLEEAALSSLVNQASNYLTAGVVAERIGSIHPNIAPYGDTFICADDRYIVLAVGSDKQFRQLCHLLGDPDLGTLESFADNRSRVLHRQLLQEALAARFRLFSRDEMLTQLLEHQVPAGAVRTLDEVLESPLAKSLRMTNEASGIELTRLSSIGFRLDSF